MNKKQRVLSLIQSMPHNYLKASSDALDNMEYETVQNIIHLIQEKFQRNPELHISVDMDALMRADRLLSEFIENRNKISA